MPIRPAIDRTLIFRFVAPASVSGIVFVTTTCSSADFEMLSIAGPDSTACVAQA